MSRISSTTLFNFTDSYRRLIETLTYGYYCKDNYEGLPEYKYGYTVPMVCFCDIPLSQIDEHLDWYGYYGVGISREYARKLGARPIWYITKEHKELHKFLLKNKKSEETHKCILPYLKKFMGNQKHLPTGKKRKIPTRKKFYDEKEWRYIPEDKFAVPHFNIKRKNAEKQIGHYHTRLEIENKYEIEYIIIKNEREFDKLTIALKRLFGSDSKLFLHLVSKIITTKQILKDF